MRAYLRRFAWFTIQGYWMALVAIAAAATVLAVPVVVILLTN